MRSRIDLMVLVLTHTTGNSYLPSTLRRARRMPSGQQHRSQYRHNCKVAEGMQTTEPLWCTVICFYAALHRIDEYASFFGRHFASHQQRTNWVLSRPELQAISQAYAELEQYGKAPRYHCPGPTHRPRNPASVQQKIIPLLDSVSQCVTDQERASHLIV